MTRLDRSAWPEVTKLLTASSAGNDSCVIIPLGSAEQHGPHLPFSTDTDIAVAVSERVLKQFTAGQVPAVLAPALPFGSSGEHQSFAGTISIGTEALTLILIELVRSVSEWGGRTLFVNGHGGNITALSAAVPQLILEHHRVAWTSCSVPELPEIPSDRRDTHAGRIETSLMLALNPDVVRHTRAEAGNTQPLGAIIADIEQSGVQAVSPNGVLGDPSGASAAEGEALLAAIVETIVTRAGAWHVDARGQLVSP